MRSPQYYKNLIKDILRLSALVIAILGQMWLLWSAQTKGVIVVAFIVLCILGLLLLGKL